MISKPIILDFNNNTGEIFNIKHSALLKRGKIYNSNLITNNIKVSLKSKEIEDKNIKSQMLKIFSITKNKFIKNNLIGFRLQINNWYDLINVNDITSKVSSILIIVKGRITSRAGASRSKTYLFRSNTRQHNCINDISQSKLILKNGSTGIKIKIGTIIVLVQ